MALRPQLPNEALGTSPRFAVVSSVPADINTVATYGSLPRAILCLGGGNLAVHQSSPYDDTGTNDLQTIPVWQGLTVPVSASKITTATTALPLLLLF